MDYGRRNPLATRREAHAAADAAIAELREVHKHAAGAMLVNYVLAMRAGGEVRITLLDIANATGGKVQVSHTETGDWIIRAVPDPTGPVMTQEEMDRYAAMVEHEEAKHANGGAAVPPAAALEGGEPTEDDAN